MRRESVNHEVSDLTHPRRLRHLDRPLLPLPQVSPTDHTVAERRAHH